MSTCINCVHSPIYNSNYAPYPDDEIVCAGAITQLKKKGWTVNLLTLTQGQPDEKTT